ncbi:aminotransferase class III-fold pyridoxal phosphate-dependent enzyme [Desulfatibacillum aliphaticivorans]|uniref:aminotransferase class III-fold pyridoxal phosphate-dependent enzyme n=1 Tax=Desulfatibacillum aliphaticivorans TaxID=218208 RepID=UPI0004051282|nr:aminotransferase class III-fold pyridoxal phosphate-dependent enzyme [Desulfatibacillum aliphaticivorans]
MDHVFQCTGHELKIPNIVDSRGMYVFDDQGKQYMDLESGVWCISAGHNNPRINVAMIQRIGTLMHAGFCYSSETLEEAAQAVLRIVGFKDGKCVFLCSGSEGIEISRQISKHLTGNSLSMTLHDSYLGSYASVTDRSKGWFLFNWEACKTCDKIDSCDPSCRLLKDIPIDVADFVFEPGSSSGFVRFPPKALIQNIVETVRGNGGKIVINEVTTGVGRTGKWFGYQHYGIQPDFVAMGKGIGNGYPVSVAALTKPIIKELEDKPFHYAQSHQNDPLGASAANAVIKEIETKGLIENAERMGKLLLPRLEALVDNEVVLEVRGRGLMFAVDMIDAETTNAVYSDLLDLGYIVGNRGTSFRIDPPLIVTEEDLNGFIEAFKGALAARKKL